MVDWIGAHVGITALGERDCRACWKEAHQDGSMQYDSMYCFECGKYFCGPEIHTCIFGQQLCAACKAEFEARKP